MKNILLLFVLSFGYAITTFAQEPYSSDSVFLTVEVNPEFPGGLQEMYAFLASETHYPVEAQEKKIEGRVYLSFVVEKDGSVTDVKIMKGAHELLNQEAVRVVKSMPKWTPGYQDGAPVRVRYTLPMTFKLNTGKSKKRKAKK